METRPALPPLTLPFGVIGLVGGALVALVMTLPRAFDVHLGEVIIPLATALVAARLGYHLSKPSFEPPLFRPWWLRVLGRAITSGGLNGLVLLSVLIGAELSSGSLRRHHLGEVLFPGTLMAWVFGASLSVLFIPSLLVVAGAHQRALAARPGSLAGRNLRGRVWLAVCVLAAAHLGAGLYWADHHARDTAARLYNLPDMTTALSLLVAAAVAGGAGVLASQFEGWRRLRYAHSLAFELEPHVPSPDGPAPAPHPEAVDLGVGEGAFVSVATSGLDPYRATEVRQVRVTGDPMETLLALRRGTYWLMWSVPMTLALEAVVAGRVLQ